MISWAAVWFGVLAFVTLHTAAIETRVVQMTGKRSGWVTTALALLLLAVWPLVFVWLASLFLDTAPGCFR